MFAKDGGGALRFHPAPDADIDDVLAAIALRVDHLLARRGVVERDAAGGTDPWSEREPVLAGLSAASIEGRLALDLRPGAEVGRCGASPELYWTADDRERRRSPHQPEFYAMASPETTARDTPPSCRPASAR